MVSYSIQTNLSPDELTNVVIEVYMQWLQFATGRLALGGQALKHPNGKYASAISWKRDGEFSATITADSNIAPEVEWIERGAQAFSLKEKMLAGVSPNPHTGIRSRWIPLPPSLDDDPGAGTMMNFSQIETLVAGGVKGQKVKKRGMPRMWAKRIGRTRGAMMSDAPGSSPWWIPARPAYSPARILSQLLARDYASYSYTGGIGQ